MEVLSAWSYEAILRSLAALGTAVLLFVALRRRYFSPLSDIPGPFVASFTASCWHLYWIIQGHVEAETTRLHQKHGALVRIGHNEVSLCSAEAVDHVLRSRMNKGPTYAIFSMPDKRYINQMAELNAEEHIRKAKNLAAGYSAANIIKIEPYMDRALEQLKGHLDKFAANNASVAFEDWFNFLAFDILGEATFSQSFGFLESGQDLGGTVRNNVFLRLYISILGHFPWMHDWLLANPLIERFNMAPAIHTFDITLAAIDKRTKNPEVRTDMLEHWKIRLSKHPDRMEEVEILSNAVGNLGAGSDTIASVLQAFVYHMIHDQDMLSQLRQELDEARMGSTPSYMETKGLPILQACIKETLRFHTPVGFGLSRVVGLEGVTTCGRTFAPGTILSVNPWAIHRMPSLFGDDAHVFNPRRWLDAEQASRMNASLIAFGTGYNQCPGQNLAHLEVTKAMAMLMRDYEIELVDPGREWKYEAYFTVAPHDWPCRIRRRQGLAAA